MRRARVVKHQFTPRRIRRFPRNCWQRCRRSLGRTSVTSCWRQTQRTIPTAKVLTATV